MKRLEAARICVVGLGGVGAAAALDLVRVGVGSIVAIDFDIVTDSNLNRLAFGYLDSVGLPKVEVFARAAARIRPECKVESLGGLLRGAEADAYLPRDCDVYLDCIDTLNAKVNVIAALLARGARFVSSMGTAGRLAPECLRVSSVWDVVGDALAQKVRQRLRRLDVLGDFAAVWSDEKAVPPAMPADGSVPGTIRDMARVRAVQGSSPFVPQAAGHLIASIAVRMLMGTFVPPLASATARKKSVRP